MSKNTDTNKGARLVAGTIIGLDYRVVVVNDKSYIIHPPTIAKIAGATFWLCETGEGNTLHDILVSLSKSECLAKALSWLIQGDDKLAEELAQGRMLEIVEGIEIALSMIEAENFMRLSALRKSASRLIAKPK